MKKLISVFFAFLLAFTTIAFSACESNESSSESGSTSQNSTQTELSASSNTQANSSKQSVSVSTWPNVPSTTGVNVFLAGDSTVKTYEYDQYIAGWGQYLQEFLVHGEVTVVNKANGGRSTRSFINEGRLFTNEEINYKNYTSIESEIKAGDYLLIQFGHNDEETNGSKFDNYIDRKVPLGTADSQGIFPTIIPEKVPTTALPTEYAEDTTVTEMQKNASLTVIQQYGSSYYSFDCGGTFKGYLKMYIDFAREKGAIPILCTPVARVKFDSAGTTVVGGNGKHGPNFEYVTAVRQLASEENCLLIDLFADTKEMLETTTVTEANYLMALKPNALKGEWPSGYDQTYDNKQMGYTGIEGTHYNKYGAYLTSAKVAETLLDFATNNTIGKTENEKVIFGEHIRTTPTLKVAPPTLLKQETVGKLSQLFATINVA